MSLSSQQRKKLQEALIDAFPMKSSLEQMLSFELDKNLDRIVGEGSLETVVFNLIKVADSQGWIEDLILAARKFNDGNRSLKAIAQEILTPYTLSAQPTPSTESLTNPIQRSREIGNRIKNQKIIITTLIIILGLGTSVGIYRIIPMFRAATVKLLSKEQPNEAQTRYDELEYSLNAKNWQIADIKTSQLMHSEDLDISDIVSFSCPDLRKIDQLWVANSNGRFGFSVQKEIWIKTGNPLGIIDQQNWTTEKIESWDRFVTAVGWFDMSQKAVHVDESIKKYNDTWPQGYFPYRASGGPYSWGGYSSAVTARIAECNL